jgi:hypothetical protein
MAPSHVGHSVVSGYQLSTPNPNPSISLYCPLYDLRSVYYGDIEMYAIFDFCITCLYRSCHIEVKIQNSSSISNTVLSMYSAYVLCIRNLALF